MKLVSLRSKLVVSILSVCALIVLAMSCVNLVQFGELEKEKIREEFGNFEQGVMQTIRKAVWFYDWDMVKVLLEGQTSQVISFVEVCDQTVSKCLQHGIKDDSPFLEFRTPILYKNNDNAAPVEIGSIYLQGHYDTFWGHVYNDFPKLLFSNILSVFGIALVLFFLVNTLVVKRLLSLERFTRKIDLKNLGGLDAFTDFPRTRSKDEIDLLADALEGLIEKTRDEFARRQTLEMQLNQAHKMEALGNLAGGIAHDFNNILAAILGFAELSKFKCEPGSELYLNLEKIIKAGGRAKNLTSQILLFSRRTESPQTVVLLAGVIHEALNIIRASLPASIRIDTDLDPDIRIRGDSTRLHQVIMNLATNSAQAIGEGGGHIRISLKSIYLGKQQAEKYGIEEGQYSSLTISDDGPGIPAEIQGRVFEPFFTTKKLGKGTGMGLAVVHGIIKNHGGAIILESELNRGTNFCIYLPETSAEFVKVEKQSNIPKGTGQKIVLVDDETQVLEMGVSVLKDLGYDVISFNDPEAAAVFLAGNNVVDLVITDLTMPEMSGAELAAASKKLRPSLPVILWTGYKDNIASASLEKNLFNRILQKPFIIQDLALAISQLLGEDRIEK